MVTLIGKGAHGRDIAADLGDAVELWLPHHRDYNDDGRDIIIGINDPWTRAKVATALDKQDCGWQHRFTCSGPDVITGTGVHLNYGVTLTRARIGNHTTVSPGVTICGDVSIGCRCLIGAGATICDRVLIGDDVTIGAGAVVLPETVIPDKETWVGVPARPR